MCPPSYRSGRADTIPVEAEKFTIDPVLLFLANSLHTENNEVKFTLKKSLNDTRFMSNNVFRFSPSSTWSFIAKQLKWNI